MYIRKAKIEDLDRIWDIYLFAKSFMRDSGNIYQWQDDEYLNKELIRKDIAEGISYVCVEEDNILGVFAFMKGPDECYGYIEDGGWPDEDDYMVVHRIATDSGCRGVGTFCLNWALEQAKNLRIDTHKMNKPMRALLAKLGFIQCGVVYMKDKSPRLAFYKKL